MRAVLAISTLLVLAVAGCPGTGTGTDDDDDTAIQDDDAEGMSCVEAMEAMLQEVGVSPNITVDWSALDEDVDGNPVDPADLASLSVAGFEYEAGEAIAGICDGTLDQADITLSSFDGSINGSTTAEIETTGMTGATLMVSVSSGEGAYSTALVSVVGDSANTVIYIENGGAVPPEE